VIEGQLAGDELSITGAQGAFADKNVGNNKVVSISGIALSGGDAGNYQLTSTTALALANIQPLIDTLLAADSAKTKIDQAVNAVIALSTSPTSVAFSTPTPAVSSSGAANAGSGARAPRAQGGANSSRSDKDEESSNDSGSANRGALNRPVSRRLPICS
jgi:hypothetical protein